MFRPIRVGFGRALLLGCLLAAGCGDDGLRREVRGQVTLDGQPLEQGSISFIPTGAEPTQSGTVIKDGQYHVPREHGLAPGKYQVRIFAAHPTERIKSEAPPGASFSPPPKEMIPPRYNSATELQATVSADAPALFDFQLKSE